MLAECARWWGMKKLRELGPQMQIFPSPFPVPHRSWHGEPPTMSKRLPKGSPCAKFRRMEALFLRSSQTSPASLVKGGPVWRSGCPGGRELCRLHHLVTHVESLKSYSTK
eukprot:1531561-Heterocapsa_arctica.AAC.1